MSFSTNDGCVIFVFFTKGVRRFFCARPRAQVSHYPASFPASMGRIAGTGMNALELQANAQLTGGFLQSDLNRQPTLPFPDNSFDVVTCVVRALHN